MDDRGRWREPGAISVSALAFVSLVVVAGGCGGKGGLPETTDAGAGGTVGTTDAARDHASDVAVDAAQDGLGDSADIAADAGRDTSDAASDIAAPDAEDGPSDGFVPVDGVLCPLPTQALITDFTYVARDGGTTTAVDFGNGTGFSGTEFVFPLAGRWPLTSDVTGNNWHITGAVGDYSGFGLGFGGCSRLNASAYRGISFTVSGTVQGGAITMGVPTLKDTIAASWLDTHGAPGSVGAGRCIPSPQAINQYAQSDCATPTKTVVVTSTPTVVTVLWSDFTGGRPEVGVSPAEILSVFWLLPTPAGVGTATPVTYPLDIVIDNLAFVP